MHLEFFKGNEIKPLGWYKKQLKTEAHGLAGNLDKIWPDIKNSAWIGGDKEGWERVPYWLDGFIPLAYLLDDEDMINRAQKYIDAIIERQCADGWICPCKENERSEYDVWAVFLITKTLTVYYDYSGDERIPEVINKALKNIYELMLKGDVSLKEWGKARWFECFISLNYFYKSTKDEWVKKLAMLLKEQGTDYSALFEKWERPINEWTFETHIVNIAMAFKAEAVSCDILEEEYTGLADKMWDFLNERHGTAVGTITGDECLSGNSPIQGTELCSVVELMYSCEMLLKHTGDAKWADRLEKAAFNALPATISEDMWSHQYDQMVNQIECVGFKGKPIFRTNGPESHMFGLEPNYGCCTANLAQGWPKLSTAAFMKTENGIASLVFIPSELKTKINGADVSVKSETLYPLRNKLEFTLTVSSNVEFDFAVRVPEKCKKVILNGEEISANDYIHIKKLWSGTEKILIEFYREISLLKRPNDLYALSYGPLVFSLPIKGEWEKLEYTRNDVERKYPYCDYNIFRKSDWNYAFSGNDFELIEHPETDLAFNKSEPMLRIKAKVQKINWGYEDGYTNVCAKIPQSRKAVSEEETAEFVPYGCTTLRMTEMPFTEE